MYVQRSDRNKEINRKVVHVVQRIPITQSL